MIRKTTDKVKLIIEIPVSDYKAICANKEDAIIAHDTCRRIAQNGTPLSDVLNEIKGEITKGQAYSSITYISNVVEIIDKHIGDKE